METLTFLFTQLALLNLALGTATFLLGLAMGRWIWGPYKAKLREANDLVTEATTDLQAKAEELREWRGKGELKPEEAHKLAAKREKELAAARDLSAAEKSELIALRKKLRELEGSEAVTPASKQLPKRNRSAKGKRKRS